MTRYILVQWPEMQLLMDHTRFSECLPLLNEIAYMCPEDLYNELFDIPNLIE